jgi:hypothetical protein
MMAILNSKHLGEERVPSLTVGMSANLVAVMRGYRMRIDPRSRLTRLMTGVLRVHLASQKPKCHIPGKKVLHFSHQTIPDIRRRRIRGSLEASSGRHQMMALLVRSSVLRKGVTSETQPLMMAIGEILRE